MRQLILTLLFFSYGAMSALSIEGRSELPVLDGIKDGDRALGIEFATQNALNKLRIKMSLGLEHDSIYVISPSIETVNVDKQSLEQCESGDCIVTNVTVVANRDDLQSIAAKLDAAKASFHSREVSLSSIELSLNTQLSILSQRYRALSDSKDMAQVMRAQWMLLIADEKRHELRLRNASSIQKSSNLLNEMNGLGWRKPSVYLSDNKSYSVKEYHVNHSDLSFEEIWKNGLSFEPIIAPSNDFVRDIEINITHFRLPDHPTALPLVLKTQYECLTYPSPQHYRKHNSVRQFVLFNNDIEVVIGGLAVGRGYVTKNEADLDKALDGDPVPRLCYLLRFELYKPHSLGSRQVSVKLERTVRDATGKYLGRSHLDRYTSKSRYMDVLDSEALDMWEVFEPSQQVLMLRRLEQWYEQSHEKMIRASVCLSGDAINEIVETGANFKPPALLEMSGCKEMMNRPKLYEEIGMSQLHNALLHQISSKPTVQRLGVESDHTGVFKSYAYPELPVRVNEYEMRGEFGYLTGKSTTYWMSSDFVVGGK